MSIVFLFGAGASYGSGECIPERPPLGNGENGLFKKLVNKGGIASTLDKELRELFTKDFEKGMKKFFEIRNNDGTKAVITFLREMAEYFVPLAPGSDNLYRKLVQQLNQYQTTLEGQTKQRIVLATTNYDLLLEQAILDTGCSVVYPKNVIGGPFVYLPRADTLSVSVVRQVIRNSYWAKYHVNFPVRVPAFEVLKVHGSCNFLQLDVQPEWDITFGGHGTYIEAPVTPVLPAKTVSDRLSRTFSSAPAIAMYAEGKWVPFSPNYVLEHRIRFQSAIEEADKIFLVGIRVTPQDTHIWEHIAASKGWLGYVGGTQKDNDKFRDWCTSNKRSNYHLLETTFEGAFSSLVLNIQRSSK